MGYRKDIKVLRKRLALFTAELKLAERNENWGRVSYLAGEIGGIVYDLRMAADSKQLHD